MNNQNDKDMNIVRQAVARALEACSCDLGGRGCKECTKTISATLRISAVINPDGWADTMRSYSSEEPKAPKEPKRRYYASECYGKFGVFQASGSQVGGWWPTMELAEQAALLGNALTGKGE
jgi:hypothetical protein